MGFDWITGLFQSEQTRGLSGDSASAVALDDSNPYYNYRLRRHRAEGDIVADPSLLWYTSPYVKRRTGLGTQIAAERGEGVANFTDVLVILSEADHDRTQEAGSEPWVQKASRALSQEFENFCRREQFSRLHSHRQLGFRILRDGSPEMGGQSLGLSEGEFVTGLLPNLYTGPVRGSWPVIGVHLNLPGIWEGYQEVGRLHNDQILFTIGSHWLDNFAHPSLREAAIYRLQQYPDGSFVHIVNPDLQDRYQVTSVQQGGTNVLTLATRDGQPLAYMVLAVIDPPDEVPAEEEPAAAARPGIAMPVAPAPKKPAVAEEPDVAPPMLIDDALQPVQTQEKRLGGKTIIPEAPSERIFTLQERGALLQKVHFSAFMDGYDVYLGRRGELGTVVEEPAATFQVRKRQVSLKAHIDLQVGGRRVTAGSEILVEGDTTIEIGSERLDYRDLRGLNVDGWPYVGEIRRPASSNYMIWGDRYRIGRSRECRVVLPDEPRNDNIHWKAGVGDGATIRARTGEIPKSRFYTDSIMVASEHATIDTKADRPQLVCQARHCYVYVRRRNEVMPLYPATSGRQPQQLELEPLDEILIGNCLFQVGFNPSGQQSIAPSAPAPEVRLSSDSLVDAVSAPDFDELDRTMNREPAGTPTPPLAPIEAPRPMETAGMDSVLGAQIEMIDDEPSLDPAPQGLGDQGPVSIPPIEDDGDEPTSPGLVIPRELLEDQEGDPSLDDPLPAEETSPEELLAPTETLARAESPAVPDPGASWEEDEWEDQTGPPEVPESPSDPGEPDFTTVPEPFPEVAEADALNATWNPDDPDAMRAASDDPPSHVEDDPTEMASAATETIPLAGGSEPPSDVGEADATEMLEVPVAPPAPVETPVQAAPPAPEPAPPAPAAAGEVVCTDDATAQFELGRPLHVVQSGWTVRGEVVAGNHVGADLVIPENRIVPDQVFKSTDYFRLKVRGKKGHIDVLSPGEMLIDEDDPKQERYDDLASITVDVIRRDDQGEEDFVVRLVVGQDASLPDPRAAFVALDYEDPLAAALVTRGLGVNHPRRLRLGNPGDGDGIELTLTWTGELLVLSDYLEGYRKGAGFRPFFIQQGDQRFVTAPEDGIPVELSPGDRFVVGNAVYLVRGV